MLGKMFIHGLVAAAVIGSAAAVYAQAKDNGYLKPDAGAARQVADDRQVVAERGYVPDRARERGVRSDDRRAEGHYRDGGRHERRHHDDHDDDDD